MQQGSWWGYGALPVVLSAALAACTSIPAGLSSPATQPPVQAVQQSCHPEPLTGAAALLGAFADITPTQALQAEAAGARVCWGGGLRTLQAVSEDRDCLVLLQAEFSEQAGLGRPWPREPRFFNACGNGPYDRQLLQPFTLVWLSGKVTGQAEFAGTPIPVIEIDALYRGSDCLEGDTAPQCVHDYLQPLKKPQ